MHVLSSLQHLLAFWTSFFITTCLLHAADPKASLIVNDYHVLADERPEFFKLLTQAKQNDVPFDGIGIQAHEPRTMRFPLDRVQQTLDKYAALSKELHITEFTPTSAGQPIRMALLRFRAIIGRSWPNSLTATAIR